MSLGAYRRWVSDARSREASLPSFFPAGVERTKRVLAGTASSRSVAKWASFGARHGKQFCERPTRRRAIALRNWGYAVAIPKSLKRG